LPDSSSLFLLLFFSSLLSLSFSSSFLPSPFPSFPSLPSLSSSSLLLLSSFPLPSPSLFSFFPLFSLSFFSFLLPSPPFPSSLPF
ncbi:hypothetical protein ACXWRW_10690, partial [Streptococcus pyogenes]